MIEKWKVLSLLGWWIVCLHIMSQSLNEQNIAKAHREARLDAMRQLAEMIPEVRISSNTTVKDFVSEDEIKDSLKQILQEAKEVGTLVYQRNGTYEIIMEIGNERIIEWLLYVRHRHPSKHPIFSINEIQQIRNQNCMKVFQAKGHSASDRTGHLENRNNVWERVSPRGRLMAIRAAEVDAYRNLAETIQSIQLTSTTAIKDFVMESDEIRTQFNGLLRRAEFVGKPVFRPDGIVEVKAQIKVSQLFLSLAEICQNRYHGTLWSQDMFQTLGNSSHRVISAVGTGLPPTQYIQFGK